MSNEGTLSKFGYGIAESYCEAFARNKEPIRDALDQALVESVIKKCPNKDKEVVIASIGAGEAFSELRLLALLIEEGYTSFHVVIIDLAYAKGKECATIPQEMRRFVDQEFYPCLSGVKVNIEAHTEYEPYLQNFNNKRPDVLLMIDLAEQQGLVTTVIDQLATDQANHQMIVGYTKLLPGAAFAYCSFVKLESDLAGSDYMATRYNFYSRGIGPLYT